MSELDVLQALERETGLLAETREVEQMRQSSYQFTVKAAQRLRRDGWALLKAPPGGNNINGVRIDKIINRSTLQIVDIIVNADDPHAGRRFATWQLQDFGRASDVVDAPAESDPPAPDPAPLPPAGDDELLERLARIVDVADSLIATNIALVEVMQKALAEVVELRTNGLRLRLR